MNKQKEVFTTLSRYVYNPSLFRKSKQITLEFLESFCVGEAHSKAAVKSWQQNFVCLTKSRDRKEFWRDE